MIARPPKSSEILSKILWWGFWGAVIILISFVFNPGQKGFPLGKGLFGQSDKGKQAQFNNLQASIDNFTSILTDIDSIRAKHIALQENISTRKVERNTLKQNIDELRDDIDQIQTSFIDYHKAYCSAECKRAAGEEWPAIWTRELGKRERVVIDHLDADEIYFTYENPNVSGSRMRGHAKTSDLSDGVRDRFQFELSEDLRRILGVVNSDPDQGMPKRNIYQNVDVGREIRSLESQRKKAREKRMDLKDQLEKLEMQMHHNMIKWRDCICRHGGVIQRVSGLQPAAGLQPAGRVHGAGLNHMSFQLRVRIMELECKIMDHEQWISDLDWEIRQLDRRIARLQRGMPRELTRTESSREEDGKGGLLQVISARYGALGCYHDVTHIVRRKVCRGRLRFSAGNHELGGDPIFGVIKHLDIRYRCDGAERTRRYREGEVVSLP